MDARPGPQNQKKQIQRQEVPLKPDFLKDFRAADQWDRIETDFKSLGLRRQDSPTVAAYLMAYYRFIQAEKTIEEEGSTYTSPTGVIRQRPEVGIAQKYLQLVKQLGAEIGLSPAARSRIDLKDSSTMEEDPGESIEDFVRSFQ